MTDLFFVVLALSSSALAQTPVEERIALWIALHDQNVRGVGIGAVSFDLSGGNDLPSTISTIPYPFEHCPVHGIILHDFRNPGDHRCIACNAQFPA